MKFAIISDTHDNISNFYKIADFLTKEKITTILHCGDICNQEFIDESAKKFTGEIMYVRGNGDYHLDSIPETKEIILCGKRIFINHYHELAKKAAESGKYDLAFYGHTHRPWEEMINNCRVVNPGEVAGQRFKPTFAVYDTDSDKLELKILEQL